MFILYLQLYIAHKRPAYLTVLQVDFEPSPDLEDEAAKKDLCELTVFPGREGNPWQMYMGANGGKNTGFWNVFFLQKNSVWLAIHIVSKYVSNLQL